MKIIGTKYYTHSTSYEIESMRAILEIEKIAHIASPNFRFIIRPARKGEKIDPKRLMRILDDELFKDGNVTLRTWRKMITESRKRKKAEKVRN